MNENSKSPIKVNWEYVPTVDAESRIAAAFDILFDKELGTDQQEGVLPIVVPPATQ